jgi:8-oxo-dGTP diphosphatase
MTDGPRTIVVVAAVVEHDGAILLTKRPSGAHLAGLWEFPGGKVEPDEDPEQALVRECEEECALSVRVSDILDVAFHRYPEKNVLLLFYDCDLVGPPSVEHLGVSDHVWCAPRDLDRYVLPPPDARVVAKIRARAARVAGA